MFVILREDATAADWTRVFGRGIHTTPIGDRERLHRGRAAGHVHYRTAWQSASLASPKDSAPGKRNRLAAVSRRHRISVQEVRWGGSGPLGADRKGIGPVGHTDSQRLSTALAGCGRTLVGLGFGYDNASCTGEVSRRPEMDGAKAAPIPHGPRRPLAHLGKSQGCVISWKTGGRGRPVVGATRDRGVGPPTCREAFKTRVESIGEVT